MAPVTKPTFYPTLQALSVSKAPAADSRMTLAITQKLGKMTDVAFLNDHAAEPAFRAAVADIWKSASPSDVQILSIIPVDSSFLRAQSGVLISFTVSLPKPFADADVNASLDVYEMEMKAALKTGLFEANLHQEAKIHGSVALSLASVASESAVVTIVQA
jgi:hypothetical protein